MNKIAILSGDGNLPYHIGETLINKNLNIIFLVLNTVINKEIYKNKKHYIIDILSIKKIIKILKQENINKIILSIKVTNFLIGKNTVLNSFQLKIIYQKRNYQN